MSFSIYKNSVQQSKLQRIKNFDSHSWLCVTSPSEDELKKLSKRLSVPLDVLHDTIDPDELPRIEIEDDALVIIFRAPKQRDKHVGTIPISIVITERHIATITTEESTIIEDMRSGRMTIFTTQRSNFVIVVATRIIQQYQKHIATIGKTIQSDKARLNTVQQTDVVRLMETEEILNRFITSLSPTIDAIKKLVSQNYIELYQQDRELVDDLLVDAEQVLGFCLTNLKTVRNIRDAYTTVMTFRLNKTLQILTYITAFLTIPMLVASIYGMNVRLPLGDHENAFWILMGATLVLITLALFFFARWRNKG